MKSTQFFYILFPFIKKIIVNFPKIAARFRFRVFLHNL